MFIHLYVVIITFPDVTKKNTQKLEIIFQLGIGSDSIILFIYFNQKEKVQIVVNLLLLLLQC